MQKGDLLFVYGTLRRGGSNDLSRFMGVSFVSSDRITGSIYACSSGWFPGLKTHCEVFDYDSPSIVGDVFLLNTDKVVAQLDAYEGYPRLYDRMKVETEEGRTVWVYTFNPPVSEDSVIKSGDWLETISLKVPA